MHLNSKVNGRGIQSQADWTGKPDEPKAWGLHLRLEVGKEHNNLIKRISPLK